MIKNSNNFILLDWFKKQTIDRKLSITVFSTTAIALMIMAFSLIVVNWITGTNDIKRHLSTHSLMIESNATGALLFEDKEKASEALYFLKAYPSIVHAVIMSSDGEVFATYNNSAHNHINKIIGKEGFTSDNRHINLTKYLYLGNDKIGTIQITSNFNQFYSSASIYIGFTILIILFSLIISIKLSKIPKKTISEPIKALQKTADQISRSHDYSIRAKRASDDEIGELVDKFNEMVAVIENNNKIIKKQTKNLLLAQSLAKVGNWEWDSTTNQVTLSKQALQILDLPSNIDSPPLDFLLNRLEDEYANLFKEAIGMLLSREQSSTTVEYQIELITGEKRRLVDELSVTHESDGRISKIIGVTQDITDRKKIDDDIQRAQKLDSIGLLAGGIAHDFNNILTMIMGNLSLCKISAKENNNKDMYDKLNQSEQAAYQARDLTQQLLTFAKGNSASKDNVNLKSILNESANMAFSGSKIIHTINYKDANLTINADTGQIRQVINNLYINAKQSMKDGGLVTTTCKVELIGNNNPQNLKPGKYIKTSIRDEGVGIEQQNIRKIFDPYYTTKSSGHGLGLSTCYSLIKNHDGTIEVTSEVNKGSTFNVYLPATNEVVIDLDNDNETFKNGEGKILVMDDEKPIGEYITTLFTTFGYTVDHVMKGEDTIELYKKAFESNQPYQVVILDLTIKGGLGGKETIEKLLEIDPHVNAIVSSGYSKDPIMQDYKKFGFKSSVSKPYLSKELFLTTTNLIKKAQLKTK